MLVHYFRLQKEDEGDVGDELGGIDTKGKGIQ